MQQTQKTGLIILAHGSRDAAWRAPFEALAERLRTADAERHTQRPVACAYLQLCAPDLPQACAQLLAAGCGHIAIAPMFLGLGTHMREDLPAHLAALQAAHPDCRFSLLQVLGDSPAMQALMAAHLAHELQQLSRN